MAWVITANRSALGSSWAHATWGAAAVSGSSIVPPPTAMLGSVGLQRPSPVGGHAVMT